WGSVDYVISYSELFSELLDRCVRVGREKFIVAGAPRNDFLFVRDGREKLQRLSGRQFGNAKLLFYLPTYRRAPGRNDSDHRWDQLFGMPSFDAERFESFLDENDAYLIMKFHPAEEQLVGHRDFSGS